MTAKVAGCVALCLVAGCDPYAVFTSGEFGRVYECRATATDVLELCTDLELEDLEADTGWDCWPTTRLWPAVTGCVFGCPGKTGCNAHHGCYCPERGS